MERSRVVVVGSVNVDIVVRVPRLPGPGETVTGGSREDHGGGKGANQAVAAARAGATVELIGLVGDDQAGARSRAELDAEGVGTAWLGQTDAAATGTAVIVVDDRGENQIAVASAANGLLDGARVAEALEALDLGEGDVCLAVFEIPDEAVEAAAGMARRSRAALVLNPAPARPLSPPVLAAHPVLVANQAEAASLSGARRPAEAARALSLLSGAPVIVTLGSSGVVTADGDRVAEHPVWPVEVVDTTGAGDSFCGALVAALAARRSLSESVARASVAAALSVTAPGARTAMPTAAAVTAALDRSGGR